MLSPVAAWPTRLGAALDRLPAASVAVPLAVIVACVPPPAAVPFCDTLIPPRLPSVSGLALYTKLPLAVRGLLKWPLTALVTVPYPLLLGTAFASSSSFFRYSYGT